MPLAVINYYRIFVFRIYLKIYIHDLWLLWLLEMICDGNTMNKSCKDNLLKICSLFKLCKVNIVNMRWWYWNYNSGKTISKQKIYKNLILRVLIFLSYLKIGLTVALLLTPIVRYMNSQIKFLSNLNH